MLIIKLFIITSVIVIAFHLFSNRLVFSLVPDKCAGPPEAGSCKNFIYKWRYDTATKECTTFVWGGCNGNPLNRFNTEAECLHHCVGEPRM